MTDTMNCGAAILVFRKKLARAAQDKLQIFITEERKLSELSEVRGVMTSPLPQREGLGVGKLQEGKSRMGCVKYLMNDKLGNLATSQAYYQTLLYTSLT